LKTQAEATFLFTQMLLFYGSEVSKKKALLQRFTYQTEEFDVFDLLAEVEAAARELELTWRVKLGLQSRSHLLFAERERGSMLGQPGGDVLRQPVGGQDEAFEDV